MNNLLIQRLASRAAGIFGVRNETEKLHVYG